jgi:protein-tyrosine phosphatase
VLNWFKRKAPAALSLPLVDIHSHLLPGLDDGVKTVDEAVTLIAGLKELGYKKLITTPHVMSDVFRNTSDGILNALRELKIHVTKAGIDIELEAAAEYYLDETLIHLLESNHPFLKFGENYLLFETNFLNEPFDLNEFIFLAKSKGYQPVLAHPERYLYLNNDLQKARDLVDRGVLFQVNLTSLTGYYSKQAQQTASMLIDAGLVHWLGTDCHHSGHLNILKGMRANRYLQKALTLPLLNNSIE